MILKRALYYNSLNHKTADLEKPIHNSIMSQDRESLLIKIQLLNKVHIKCIAYIMYLILIHLMYLSIA